MTNVNPNPAPVVIRQRASEPGCLLQILWFVFVGWWLGLAAISVAWVLNVTIVGLPLGMAILNNIPQFLALQSPERYLRTVAAGGRIYVAESGTPQVNFFVRAAYFLLIGWWWSAVWLSIAYALCATVVLLPLGLPMFRMTPAMTTLRRY